MAKNSGWGKFFVGATIGAGIALLFAPQEGSKTRKQLKAKFDELSKKVKEIDPVEVKQNIENKIAEIKADLQDLDREEVLEYAKIKATNIAKKMDELVKIGIKKGTPVVKKTVNDLRLKTIDVLEETIVKLEKDEDKKAPVKKTAAKKTTKKKTVKKASAKK